MQDVKKSGDAEKSTAEQKEETRAEKKQQKELKELNRENLARKREVNDSEASWGPQRGQCVYLSGLFDHVCVLKRQFGGTDRQKVGQES